MSGLPQTPQELEAYLAEREKLLQRLGDESRAERDWEKLVMLADSQHRAAALVEACRASSDSEAGALLAEWFNLCDAIGEYTEPLREQFERVGFVCDIKENDTETPQLVLPVTVYRAQWGNDPRPERALSWTTRREVAESFARYLTGPRAWFLGIKRDDDEPWVWQARCTEAFGWITGRGEAEVIAKTLRNLRPISKLLTVRDDA